MSVVRRLHCTSSRGLRWQPISKAMAALRTRSPVRHSSAGLKVTCSPTRPVPRSSAAQENLNPHFAGVLLGSAHTNFYAYACRMQLARLLRSAIMLRTNEQWGTVTGVHATIMRRESVTLSTTSTILGRKFVEMFCSRDRIDLTEIARK